MTEEKPVNRKPLGLLPNGTSIRVIVVDDEFSHRRIMVQVLKSASFDVVAEGVNGEDALKMVPQFKPKFLFMDYHMPRVDGLEALKKLHVSNPDTKVVICTTDNDKDHVLELLKSGACEYIVKPIDRKVVMQKLEKLVGLPPS
ncbi:MAG: response regulator [Spirochaetales bacterium]